ncbi:helix-turn-helix domain-containing protein [Ruminiclostridium papyrosolvens]|uniref:helix-turn-helix domain-containing protein n=1 Tax=Ruminiclostridium papyrosolvens TaxID=29362 RepID=UPI0004147215
MIKIVTLKLKQIRKRKRLTQIEFANLLGVSQCYVTLLESGKRTPSMSMLEQFSEKLGIPIEKLLSKPPKRN